MLALGSGLLAKHVVAFPEPRAAELTLGIAKLRATREEQRWLTVHVLYSDCRCSRRIADHLVASERPADWSELVLWIGEDSPPKEMEARFDVRRLGSSDLARLGIEAAPSLVVVDPAGQVRYVGGYTDRKQGPVAQDVRIMNAVRQSQVVASLPLFGCAVSDRLKNDLAILPAL